MSSYSDAQFDYLYRPTHYHPLHTYALSEYNLIIYTGLHITTLFIRMPFQNCCLKRSHQNKQHIGYMLPNHHLLLFCFHIIYSKKQSLHTTNSQFISM
jgi:hypothetical protein